MAKRIIVRVKWSKTHRLWEVVSPAWFGMAYRTRRAAIKAAARDCRAESLKGTRLELQVHNKTDGRLSERRTYLHDPREIEG